LFVASRTLKNRDLKEQHIFVVSVPQVSNLYLLDHAIGARMTAETKRLSSLGTDSLWNQGPTMLKKAFRIASQPSVIGVQAPQASMKASWPVRHMIECESKMAESL
jgi:hypothetical protein